MRVTVPNWVKHTDEKDKKSAIFSISVHPDGTRIATGGLDKKVKVWSTLPILDKEADEDESNHKLLCTMSAHTGSVLSVRWAHHGRFLASGSDDTVIVLWGIDPDGGGRVFGSDDVNVENWKALKRLVGHTADIIDIAWSRDDSMMASVGLDKLVWIWDGSTFERIRKLDLHGDFVKGVCWDPVGNFLATQSDDKTVKIWNTENWSLVHSVAEPFRNSPKSTFFRRLSWSPDGAFIAASNAMNGPVFVGAVIEREEWRADISFVGHANTIQVAAFNPRLFFRAGVAPCRAEASSMLALGADDFSISIWRNTLHKPLVVLNDIFNRPLLDLCWGTDGYHLYGCSADGTICAITFEVDELPELADLDKTEVVLNEYGYKPVKRMSRPTPQSQPSSMANGFGVVPPSSGHVNVLQPRKGKSSGPQRRRVELGGSSKGSSGLGPPMDSGDAFSSAQIQPLGSVNDHTARMFEDAHSAFVNGESGAGSSMIGQKRKADGILDDRILKGRTMGVSSNSNLQVKEIRAPRVNAISSGSGSSGIAAILPIPTIQNLLRVKSSETNDGSLYMEAINSVNFREKTKVICSQGGQNQWIDYLPHAVVLMAINERIGVVASEDGWIYIYSPAGRHLSNLKLDSICSELAIKNDMAMLITANGICRVIDGRYGKSLFTPCSVSHLLTPLTSSSSRPTNYDIVRTEVRANGLPIIMTSKPQAFAFDAKREGWTSLSSAWWLEVSPASDQRTSPGPLADIEAELARTWRGSKMIQSDKEEWFNVAAEMGHLENRMRAAELLESKEEYRASLTRYAGVLGREGFRERAEELIQDFTGPIYNHARKDTWDPSIMGLQKRELARQVLITLNRTSLSSLAQHYQGLLGQVAAEEANM